MFCHRQGCETLPLIFHPQYYNEACLNMTHHYHVDIPNFVRRSSRQLRGANCESNDYMLMSSICLLVLH